MFHMSLLYGEMYNADHYSIGIKVSEKSILPGKANGNQENAGTAKRMERGKDPRGRSEPRAYSSVGRNTSEGIYEQSQGKEGSKDV